MFDDGLMIYFDDEIVVEILKFWQLLSQEYGIMLIGMVEWGILCQVFFEGQMVMMWYLIGNLMVVKNNVSFDFGVVEFFVNVCKGFLMGGGNFYIFKDILVEEKVVVFWFIEFMILFE